MLPEIDTAAAAPPMSRSVPSFVAVTLNVPLRGFDDVFSAASNTAVSVAPFTFAPIICDFSTVTVTVSVADDVPSFTVNSNTKLVEPATPGATNTGLAVLAPTSPTAGPPVCFHA